MPEMAPLTIEGDIESISWQAAKKLKGRPGLSGSAGHDRTIPAHYKLVLHNTVVTVAKDASGFREWETGQKIHLKINREKDDGYLRKAMRIRVTDYKSRGDEGGVSTSFTGIEILKEKTAQKAKP